MVKVDIFKLFYYWMDTNYVFFWYRLDILIFVFLQDFVAKANGSVRAGLASQRSVFDIFRHEEVKTLDY